MFHLHARAIWAIGLTTMIAFACSSGSSDDHTSDASVYAADGPTNCGAICMPTGVTISFTGDPEFERMLDSSATVCRNDRCYELVGYDTGATQTQGAVTRRIDVGARELLFFWQDDPDARAGDAYRVSFNDQTGSWLVTEGRVTSYRESVCAFCDVREIQKIPTFETTRTTREPLRDAAAD